MFETPYGAVPLKDDSNVYVHNIMKNIIHNINLYSKSDLRIEVSTLIYDIDTIDIDVTIRPNEIDDTIIIPSTIIKYIHECITYYMYRIYYHYYVKEYEIDYHYISDGLETFDLILKIK